ncbi:hypothetical protein IU500_31745 [Nocardia terpenica]|uniref:hypothetical protein n=1 Tax=Nocardia terpenica TaxID=455432 RepID=UPI001894FB48|nr:hypothetical protein [Nocardia terpenica]MBF6066277.1 hypothetical protein [Nocardia terpenica]MBF6108593.1 hypothetical protein [Nocardia terpenica]MBF6116139.1 hypothetical protein [Nocardia terpenica]MBF6123740.1 hypothetical protein [Nocardia terpenica]MBF6157113.1 hypothetical protein [Nocardia terpenica]
MADLASVYDEAAQDTSEWIAWDDPRRSFIQIDTLFDETLPALPVADDAALGETVPPRPQAPRYSPAMLEWVEYAAFALFPTRKALATNTDAADQFVCYLIEYLVRNAGGLRFNVPGNGSPVYDGFGPSVCYNYASSVDNPVDMLLTISEHGEGFADDIITRAEDCADSAT